VFTHASGHEKCGPQEAPLLWTMLLIETEYHNRLALAL
jgi:hypothetical protein